MEISPVVKRKQLLLVEPQSLFRRTLATVARQIAAVDIIETSSHESAREVLEKRYIDGLMLNIGDGLDSLAMLQALRHGQTRNSRNLPVALMAEAVDPATIELFKSMHPQRIMLMPFKVKTALEVVTALAGDS